jgi:hypothetical protein
MIQFALLLIAVFAGRQLLYICVGYADYILETARERHRLRKAIRRDKD